MDKYEYEMEQIKKIIDDEINLKVSSALTKFAEKISLSHKIPLSLLLRDIPTTSDIAENVTCLGLLAKGTRCSRRGVCEGYCKMHLHQKKDTQPIQIVQSGPQHNHGIPPFFKEDCPACCACRPPQVSKKPLIDFGSILRNESF